MSKPQLSFSGYDTPLALPGASTPLVSSEVRALSIRSITNSLICGKAAANKRDDVS